MGYVHSPKAIDLLIALWHDHTPEEPGHAGIRRGGPQCQVCKPLHFLLGWSWEEYKRWVETSVQPVRKEMHIGTRGIVGVIVDGTAKVTYNHYDSYPSALGVNTLRALRNFQEGYGRAYYGKLAELARNVRLIDEQGAPPTPEDRAALDPYTDLRVAGQSEDDWYCLTRNLQGRLLNMLEVGYMLDAADFPKDSLFCEWGYVINLVEDTFEVYEGFQHAEHQDGWWRNSGRYERSHGDYYAIRRVHGWPLGKLPTGEEFLKVFGSSEAEE